MSNICQLKLMQGIYAFLRPITEKLITFFLFHILNYIFSYYKIFITMTRKLLKKWMLDTNRPLHINLRILNKIYELFDQSKYIF